MSNFRKQRGRFALSMRCTGNLIVPEALEQKFNVTRSFDLFLPLAVFSKLPARVTSGKSRKLRPVSSQLKI